MERLEGAVSLPSTPPRLCAALQVQHHLIDAPDDLVHRYARRLANRPPSIGARIKEPARTIEVACFLRDCLLVSTDRLLLMVRRCVADVWQQATRDAKHVLIHWADLYRELLGSTSRSSGIDVAMLAAQADVGMTEHGAGAITVGREH